VTIVVYVMGIDSEQTREKRRENREQEDVGMADVGMYVCICDTVGCMYFKKKLYGSNTSPKHSTKHTTQIINPKMNGTIWHYYLHHTHTPATSGLRYNSHSSHPHSDPVTIHPVHNRNNANIPVYSLSPPPGGTITSTTGSSISLTGMEYC